MTFVLGLTGSIGMGKSTTARMFSDAGLDVWDADATVHRLYSTDNPVTRQIASLVPGSVQDNSVDRAVLKQAIAQDPKLLSRIEAIVAPHVAADRDAFIAGAASDIVVIDHPLLFESGTHAKCDATVVVTVDAQEQRRRVLERGTMTEQMLDTILAKQMPNADKIALADYVIETTTLDAARKKVGEVIARIRGKTDA